MRRHFPDWIDAYMKYTDNTEPSDQFRLWTAIATVGAALERRVWLNWENTTYCNMFIVIVGSAGHSRKGTAMKPAKRLLSKLGVNLAAESMTREALIKRLSNTSTAMPQVQLATGQFTQPHASLTIWSEEWTVLIGYNNQILMADLNNLYDCPDTWLYETKMSGIFPIENVWLHMYAATTPQLLQTTLPQDSFGGGLTSRTVFVCQMARGKLVMFPIQTAKEKAMETQLIEDLKNIHDLHGAFSFTEEFARLYVEWRYGHEKNPPFMNTVLESYSARRQTHLIKLAMILCAARCNDMILLPQDIKRAATILTKTEENMLIPFRGIGRSDYAAITNRMMGIIFTKKAVTRREITKLMWQDATETEIDAVLQTLIIMEFIEVPTSDVHNTYIKLKEPKE